MSELYDSVENLANVFRQANELYGNMAVELAAMTQERDALRRDVQALVDVIVVGSPRCAIYHKRQIAPCNGQAVTVEVCRRCVVEWARQQAAKAGKDVTK